MSLSYGTRASVRLCARPSGIRPPALSNINTRFSKATRPIGIKFYLKHHYGRGKVHYVFGQFESEPYVPWQETSLISLISLIQWKKKKQKKKKKKPSPTCQGPVFRLFAEMYSTPLYKSCQPCPSSLNSPRPGAVINCLFIICAMQ